MTTFNIGNQNAGSIQNIGGDIWIRCPMESVKLRSHLMHLSLAEI